MSNSAISFNTAGLASTTSPGLVGTGAQTFAGKKTLDGGALIKGDTSGVAIASGYVGEKITWAVSPSNFAPTSTIADWTNASIVLSAGTWLVQANVNTEATTTTTVGNANTVVVQITDSANNIVQSMEKQLTSTTPAAASMNVVACLSFSFVANLSGSTTYKIRSRKTGAGGATLYNTSTAYSEFIAIRIA